MAGDPIQNAIPEMPKWNLARMEEFRLKPSTFRHFVHDTAPPDFFLFEQAKGELDSRPVTEINEVLHVVKAILGTLSIETISGDFSNGPKD
jgi:hypothetical protein